MKSQSFFKVFLLLCCIAIVWAACKKNNSAAADSGSDGFDSSATVAITPVGTPIGSPVSKNIGAAGGTITSPDGVLVLTIPAGALATATNISIQPVTAQMPDSMGLGYSLLPNGTKFNVPVTLTFHYTANQFPDNNPEFSTIAYQDATGAWISDPVNRDFDTTAKTVSLAVSHFTTFEMNEWLYVRPAPSGPFHENDKTSIFVAQSFWVKATGPGIYPGQKWRNFQELQSSQVQSWQVEGIVGGSDAVGRISQNPGTSRATYQAPAQITAQKIVTVKCVTKIHEVVYKNGKVYEDNPNLSRSYPLTLLPNPEYNITVTYYLTDSTVAPDFSKDNSKPSVPVYTDSVKFDANVKVTNHQWTSTVPTSSIVNGAPTVNPSTASKTPVTWTWTPDLTGEINVATIVGRDGDLADDSIITFDVYHKGALLPGWFETLIGSSKVIDQVPVDPYPAETGAVTLMEIDLRKIPYSRSEGAIGQWNKISVKRR